MGISNSALLLLISSLAGVHAQDTPVYEIGLGEPDSLYVQANQNPLNKTSVTFPGFDLSADAGSTNNATSGQWTWNAGLSIVNTETNETNYPISSAANSTSNVINIAYTLDFPGGQLPQQNYTNWTICSHVVEVPWTTDVLQRAPSDPGDCSTVLGASILNEVRQGWQASTVRRSATGCPDSPDLGSISGFNSLTTNGYGIYSSSIMSLYSDPNNRSSPVVGLESGQIFSFEKSNRFDASQAETTFDQYSSALRMVVLTFTPSRAYQTNYSGVINSGEVRTFCSILNKDSSQTNGPETNNPANAAPSLSAYHAIGVVMLAWALLFTNDFL